MEAGASVPATPAALVHSLTSRVTFLYSGVATEELECQVRRCMVSR